MKENLTELIFILDRSGSMGTMMKEAIGGFNSFLEEQKKLPGEAKLTLALFDNHYDLMCNGKDIKCVEPLDERTYVPRGTTALLDAIGRTVDDVGRRLNDTPENERPSKVLVAILTDGLENASRDYSRNKINDIITHQRGKYSWEFLFLAANQDAIDAGTKIGIDPNMSYNYCCSSVGGTLDAFKSVTRAACSYRTTGIIGDVDPIVKIDLGQDKDSTNKS
jgi:uncharacterized protein YegL